MIIRTLPLRHGRHALPKSHPSLRLWRRTLTSSPATPPQPELPPLSSRSSLKPEDIRDPNHPVARDFLFRQHQRERTDHLGAVIDAPKGSKGSGKPSHYQPHLQLSSPPRPEEITLELLLASQAHLGHATALWHPGNAKYIHGIRASNGTQVDPIHIISLDVTAAYLRRTCAIVRGVTERGGLVLFVGTRSGQARCVVRAAQLAQGCHLFTKWTPGSITNGQQILGRCGKKVVDEFDQEVLGFQDQLRPQAALKPDLVVCLNPLENYVLLQECAAHNVPTIGIVDTDVNPTWVTYPIPANDDSLRCVQLIAGVLGRAGQEGQRARLALAKSGRISYEIVHRLKNPTQGQAEKELAAAERELHAQQLLYEQPGQITLEHLSSAAVENEALAAAQIEEGDDVVDLNTIDPSLLQDAGVSSSIEGRDLTDSESEPQR